MADPNTVHPVSQRVDVEGLPVTSREGQPFDGLRDAELGSLVRIKVSR